MNRNEPASWRGWMVLPLRRYAQFRGRSGRREFWWYCLFLTLGYAAVTALAFPLAATTLTSDTIGFWLVGGWCLFFILNLIPGLALTTRRLHDMGLSGALLIVIFFGVAILNLIGWIAYMAWMSLPSQQESNRHGLPIGQGELSQVFS